MDRSAVLSATSTMSAGPWLTRPFRGLIGRFGIAFMIPVLEATLLITLLALALCDLSCQRLTTPEFWQRKA